MQETNLNGNGQNEYSFHSPSMRDLLAIAFRRRRLMALSFFGVLLGAILLAVLEPKRYEAEMKVLVNRGRVDPIVTPEASVQPQTAPELTEEEINSEVELLKSRDLLTKVVLACNLQQSNNFALTRIFSNGSQSPGSALDDEVRIEKAVAALAKKLKVEVIKKTNLIAVSYESANPQAAAQVLKTLANLYLEKHVTVHRPPGASEFFQQASERYGMQLADAETRLANFSQGSAVVSAQLEKETALQKLAEFDGTLKQTQASIAEAQQRMRILEQEAAAVPGRIITQTRSADDAALLSQLRSNLLNLELKRTELLEKFQPTYRPVQELETQIAQTRNAIAEAEKSPVRDEITDQNPTYAWVSEELAKTKADLAGLQARAHATSLAVQSYRENARSLEQKQVVQDDLVRTVKLTEDNYLLYLRKQEEAHISDALDRGKILNVVIAEAATVPSLPSDHRLMTILVGSLLAVLTSLGLGFASEHLDPTFRTPDEVTSFLNIPVLAAMPQNVKTGKNGANGVATNVS